MSWVVLGASGFVGSAVVAALEAAGEPVRSLPAPRLTASADDGPALAAAAALDPALDPLAEGLRGATTVVLAAGAATPDAADSPALTGANALLPAVVALACDRAGVARLVHLSSAAVQGRTPVLDETATTAPFSPYSRSKAAGEQVLAALAPGLTTQVVVVRATSVQGPGRATTAGLRRVAGSPLASVAGAGDAPSPVSAVADLAAFVHEVGRFPGPVPFLVLQPWAGLSTAAVLELAGGRPPRRLPQALCRAAVGTGYAVSRLARGRLDGPVRRVEAMWFGQRVDDAWARAHGLTSGNGVPAALGRAG